MARSDSAAATALRYSTDQLFAAIREDLDGEESSAALGEIQRRWEDNNTMDANSERLLKAAQRIVALDEEHGLPDIDSTPFDVHTEWVAALFALKEAVRDAER